MDTHARCGLAALVLWSTWQRADALPLVTCAQQQDCITWSIRAIDPDVRSVCIGEPCAFEACMSVTKLSSCGASARQRLNHTCPCDESSCNPGHEPMRSGSAPELVIGGHWSKQCQAGAAGSTLVFIIQDGNDPSQTCTKLAQDNQLDLGAVASCAPGKDSDDSCISPRIAATECYWRIKLPGCLDSPTHGGSMPASVQAAQREDLDAQRGSMRLSSTVTALSSSWSTGALYGILGLCTVIAIVNYRLLTGGLHHRHDDTADLLLPEVS